MAKLGGGRKPDPASLYRRGPSSEVDKGGRKRRTRKSQAPKKRRKKASVLIKLS